MREQEVLCWQGGACLDLAEPNLFELKGLFPFQIFLAYT